VALGVGRLTSISQKLNLNKSTVHRLLNSLEKTGLVVKDAIARQYYLGNLFLSLASTPEITHMGLLICAREELEKLREATNETVCLHVRVGTQRICLEELPSHHAIKFTVGRGTLAPIYTGASGKILLQNLSKSELDGLLKIIKLVPIGPNTITSKNKLVQELQKAKQQGYAMSFSERVPGSASVSVLITGYITAVALSVIGPEDRVSMGMQRIVRNLRASGRRISEKLKNPPYSVY
jgi:DNA-binding IclR family transcriptional regulator